MSSRSIGLFFVCAFPLVAFACGGDDSTSITPPGDGGQQDVTQGGDSGNEKDGAADSSNPGQDSSVADSGADDSATQGDVVQLGCTDPSTCGSSSPYCCATITTGAGQAPNCPVNSLVAQCEAQCNSQLSFQCNATETLRLCSQAKDCTEKAYSNCCEFKQGNQTVTFCAPNQITGLAVKCY